MTEGRGGVADAENDAAACGVVADVVEVEEEIRGEKCGARDEGEVKQEAEKGKEEGGKRKPDPLPAQTAGIRDDRGG